MSMSLSDIMAAVSAVIAILALFVGLYATFVSRRVATGDFQAVERVKLDTAKLIAVLRSLMIKGIVYTQQDNQQRDDPTFEAYVDIVPEQKAMLEFMHSPTALAYYSFVARKSKVARKARRQGEEWRVFFLHLGELQQMKNPWRAANVAARLERQLNEVGEKEFREIASNLEDIPKAIALLFSEREHDVLTYVLVERDVSSEPITEDNFMDFVKFLREVKGIDDPELDVFWAASSGDVQLLEAAHKKGANLQITSGALINRYKEFISEFEKRSTALSEDES